MTHRIDRINTLLSEQLSQLIETSAEEIGMVAVVSVQTARDLSQATILVAPVSDSQRPGLLENLAKKSLKYRRILGKKLDLKRIPELHFKLDVHRDEYNRLEALLDQVSQKMG